MENQVAKSKFKPHALQYFREVERTGKALIITDRGKPVLKIVPYSEEPSQALKMLRNSVIKYENPTEPVGIDDWEAVNNQGWGAVPFSGQNLLTLSQDLGKMKAIKSERWETYSTLLRNAMMHETFNPRC